VNIHLFEGREVARVANARDHRGDVAVGPAFIDRLDVAHLQGGGRQRASPTRYENSAATWLLQAGVDVGTVSEVLGDSSPMQTMSTYAHVLPGAQTRAVEAIADRLRSRKPASDVPGDPVLP